MLERCSRRKESLNSRAAPATTDLRMHPQYSRIDESFLLDDCAGLRIEVTRIVKRRAISGRRRMSGTRAFKKLVNSDQMNGGQVARSHWLRLMERERRNVEAVCLISARLKNTSRAEEGAKSSGRLQGIARYPSREKNQLRDRMGRRLGWLTNPLNVLSYTDRWKHICNFI